MKVPILENQTLQDLVKQYVTWQGRLDALEEKRPGIYARLLEQQQIAMEGKGNLEALQEVKLEIQNYDLQIEAALGKLNFLWDKWVEAVEADIAARRAAEPESRAALEQEYQEKCVQAAALLVQGLEITDSLAISRAYIVHYLGLVEEERLRFVQAWGEPPNELKEEINRLRQTRKPAGVTWRQKESALSGFMVRTTPGSFRQTYIHTTFNRALLALGGRFVMRHLGAGDLAHEPRKE